jgi:hypothetical protein
MRTTMFDPYEDAYYCFRVLHHDTLEGTPAIATGLGGINGTRFGLLTTSCVGY